MRIFYIHEQRMGQYYSQLGGRSTILKTHQRMEKQPDLVSVCQQDNRQYQPDLHTNCMVSQVFLRLVRTLD